MRAGLLTAVAIVAVAFSGVAQASVITESFTGSIISGSDNMGAFGAVGANLAGDTVTFSFSYDTGPLEGNEYTVPFSFEQYTDDAGDSAFAESVTINSQTFAMTSGSGLGILVGCMEGTCYGLGGGGVFVADTEPGNLAFIETRLDITQTYLTGDDLLSQTEVDALLGGWIYSGTIQMANGVNTEEIELRNIYVAEPSATPEPTTWISLALGFGMVGLLKRRRNAR
jgi:hypothetical protein